MRSTRPQRSTSTSPGAWSRSTRTSPPTRSPGRSSTRATRRRRSADRQALGRRRDLLRQRQREHAVVELRDGLRLVHFGAQREAARHRAVVALAAQHAFAVLLLGLALDFRADRHAIAVDLDVDVFLFHARHLGLDDVLAVGLLDLDADLERIAALRLARLDETAEQLRKDFGERVVD